MKKFFYAASCAAIVLASSCKKESASEKKEVILSGTSAPDTIRGILLNDTTLTRNTFIDGIVFVDAGVTLTINAGVTMIGRTTDCGQLPNLTNLAANKGTLVIQRGAQLIANGTPTQPIVWTSSRPSGSKIIGDWGGLVINGAAPITTALNQSTNTFEAFTTLSPAFVARSNYGGTDAADNSGSITYNRIEFCGGIVTQENQEVNGLTLCGVGSGTTINHVEVLASNDDAFEFFGGTVNAKYLLSYGNRDDDFDFDEGYRGNLQFIIAFRTNVADQSGSETIELDNNSASAAFPGKLRTRPFISNATLIGPGSLSVATLCPVTAIGRFDGGVYVRRNGRIVLLNSLIIAQAFPTAFASTPTTDASFFGPVPPPLSDSASTVISNIFQTASANPVVLDGNESNPIAVAPFTGNGPLINRFASQNNTALGSFGDFQLGGTLENTPSSPSFTGGIDLAALGLPFFHGTTERGAVISSDVWTAQPWLSIAAN